MCMHERHVRQCCLWLITSRTTTFQLPINKANPAGFQRLCCGDSGSPVPLDSSCISPLAIRRSLLWPSNPLGWRKGGGGTNWSAMAVEWHYWRPLCIGFGVCVGSVKTPHMITFCPGDSTFLRPFSLSSYNNGQLCSSEEGWGDFSPQRLDTLLSHMALHMLTSLHLLAGN